MEKISLVFFLFLSSAFIAQNKSELLDKAQEAYANKDFEDALFYYQKLDSLSGQKGDYAEELAQTLYRLKKFNEARNAYSNKKTKESNADIDYNVGNTFYNEGNYQDAINAYRDALRKNPNDAEARHNLSLAMRKNRNDKKKPKNKEDKNNDDKNDQNQLNKKDQQKKEDKKDEKQLDSKSKRQDGNQGQEKPVPQETSQELSNKDIEKRKVEKMLENLAIEEMKTKSKVNNAKGKSRRISKPW